MTKILTALSLAALLLATPALAQPGPGGGPRGAMAMADTNNDGAIDKAEFQAAHSARFDRIDSAKKGAVGKDAFLATIPPRFRSQEREERISQRVAAMDTNKDGLVSREEHAAAGLATFERMDANKDGKLSAGEGRQGRGGAPTLLEDEKRKR